MSVSFLVPAYNEETTLESVVERCLAVSGKLQQECEVIILDDTSKDRTWEIAEMLSAKHREVRALRHPVNQGIAVTFEELYGLAKNDVLFLTPGDAQYPPELLEKCLPLIQEGTDIVICKRTQKNYTPYRHLISYGYRALPMILFGVDLHDPGSVKCMRTSIVKEIPIISQSVFAEVERVIRAVRNGKKTAVVEFEPEIRNAGVASGARIKTVVAAVRDMIKVRWSL